MTTDARMAAFRALDESQQKQAVTRLAASGMSEYGISHATGLSVEFVRRLLIPGEGEFRRDRGQTPVPLCTHSAKWQFEQTLTRFDLQEGL